MQRFWKRQTTDLGIHGLSCLVCCIPCGKRQARGQLFAPGITPRSRSHSHRLAGGQICKKQHDGFCLGGGNRRYRGRSDEPLGLGPHGCCQSRGRARNAAASYRRRTLVPGKQSIFESPASWHRNQGCCSLLSEQSEFDLNMRPAFKDMRNSTGGCTSYMVAGCARSLAVFCLSCFSVGDVLWQKPLGPKTWTGPLFKTGHRRS